VLCQWLDQTVVKGKINVSYGVNPLFISALWEYPPPAAAKRIYGASKSQKSQSDF
jgi:hypothetical protein